MGTCCFKPSSSNLPAQPAVSQAQAQAQPQPQAGVQYAVQGNHIVPNALLNNAGMNSQLHLQEVEQVDYEPENYRNMVPRPFRAGEHRNNMRQEDSDIWYSIQLVSYPNRFISRKIESIFDKIRVYQEKDVLEHCQMSFSLLAFCELNFQWRILLFYSWLKGIL
jgi:hypothetical protein